MIPWQNCLLFVFRTAPAFLQGWAQGLLFRYADESTHTRGRIKSKVRRLSPVPFSSASCNYFIPHRYTHLDTKGNSVAHLHWVGHSPDGDASIWSLAIMSTHVAWFLCCGWPVTADGRALTQHWYAGEWPKKDYAISAVCWPEAAPAPVWGTPKPPPLPPPPASAPDNYAFERLEHSLRLQAKTVTDAVQKFEQAAEQLGQTEHRLQTLEASLECESQMRQDREQYYHDLVNMSSKHLTDYVQETFSSSLEEVKACCESTENFSRQNSEILESSMEQRIDTVTAHMESTVRAAETDVKQQVETRLQAHDAILGATIDAVETRITKRVCTSVLRNIFGAMQQVQNTSRVLEAFSLTQALCDAATDCADGEETGFDECLQPHKKLRSVSPSRIVQGKWV